MLRNLVRYTYWGRLLMMPARFFLGALPIIGRQFLRSLRWVFTSREYYNHTYHLTALNQQYLASYVAVVSGHAVSEIEAYMRELEADDQLRAVLQQQAQTSRDRFSTDQEPRYGRRVGWYALVRATRPRVVLETGVDRGLGTAVIAAALRRNEIEGYPGMVYATDIMPDCGHLIAEPYRQHCRILLGDSVESLKKFTEPVDVFLHDSDHRAEYEWAEFLAIEPRLHDDSIVMSDNSQATPKLREFAHRRNMSFLFFQDQPLNHWWPGDGIGTAFVPGRKIGFQ